MIVRRPRMAQPRHSTQLGHCYCSCCRTAGLRDRSHRLFNIPRPPQFRRPHCQNSSSTCIPD